MKNDVKLIGNIRAVFVEQKFGEGEMNIHVSLATEKLSLKMKKIALVQDYAHDEIIMNPIAQVKIYIFLNRYRILFLMKKLIFFQDVFNISFFVFFSFLN